MNQGYFNPNIRNGFTNDTIKEKEEIITIPKAYTFSTLEEILKAGIRSKLKIYMTFKDSSEWKDHTFEGILEGSSKEFLILSDPSTGNFFVLPMNAVNYFEFYENFNKSSL